MVYDNWSIFVVITALVGVLLVAARVLIRISKSRAQKPDTTYHKILQPRLKPVPQPVQAATSASAHTLNLAMDWPMPSSRPTLQDIRSSAPATQAELPAALSKMPAAPVRRRRLSKIFILILEVVLVVLVSVFLISSAVSFELASPASAPVPPVASTSHEWFNQDWKHRQLVTLNSEQISEDQENFPVLIKITDPRHAVFAYAKPDASDIIFIAADGVTRLSHEIENYNTTAKSLSAWVLVPRLLSEQDTQVYLYFGNHNELALPEASDVWQKNYAAVYLMNQGPKRLEIKDSTQPFAQSEHIATLGVSREEDGKLGSAVAFNGQNTVVDLKGVDAGPTIDVVPPLTISAWVKPTTLAGTILSKRDGSGQQWQFFTDAQGTLMIKEDATGRWPGGQSQGTSRTAIKTGVWQFVAVTINESGTPTFYNNGQSEVGNYTNGTFVHRPINAAIGARWTQYPATTYLYNGLIDDVRLAREVRSISWLATEFANQNQPETFVDLNDQVQALPASSNVRNSIQAQASRLTAKTLQALVERVR